MRRNITLSLVGTVLIAVACRTHAQSATTDPVGMFQFPSPSGVALPGQTEPNAVVWEAAGPAGPAIRIGAGNLFVPGMDTAQGNHAVLAGVSGPAARIGIGSNNIAAGPLYYSLTMKVSDLGGLGPVGGAVVGLHNATGSGPNLPEPLAAAVMVRAQAGGYQIGAAKNASNVLDAVWSPQVFGSNDTVFLVVSYFGPDDWEMPWVTLLWVNPPAATFDSDTPPAPTLIAGAGDNIEVIRSLVLLQGPPPFQPAVTRVDEILVGTSWAAVTPVGADYGDAPDTYQTVRTNNGPRHRLTGPILGSLRDRDPDGRPTRFAQGDDVLDGTDDEDGIIFPASMIPGTMASVQVTSAGGGNVDAWIDFDRDNMFDHPAEQIAAAIAVPPGTSPINFLVPTGIPLGGAYARFRISTVGGLSPWGAAPDGEVEDYGPGKVIIGTNHSNGRNLTLSIIADDEALESDVIQYTLVVSNAGPDVATAVELVAEHGGVLLGTLSGSSSQGTVQVAGTTAYGSVASLPPAQTALFQITVGLQETPAPEETLHLTASVDSDVPDVAPPDNVATGTIRRRGKDWGDAPVGYPVTALENGAWHSRGTNWWLGTARDGETNGTHSANADHDDTHGSASDDEDGVIISGATGTISVQVIAGRDGYLDAWVDFHRDLDWDDTGEQVFARRLLTAGTNNLSITVPGYATSGNFVSRWRFSESGGLSPKGFGGVGEVEDHIFAWQSEGGNLDFGDAPDSYHTVLTNDGPRHAIVSGWVLGAYVDYEPDGQPSGNALLDDTVSTAALDDEDGVRFLSPLVRGGTATVQVVAYPAGRLDAWVDFNGNNEFDHPGSDQIFMSQLVGPGTNILTFLVPASAPLGATYARFRLSGAGNLPPTGAASEGEVEDYRVNIIQVNTNTPPTTDYGDAPNSYLTLAASGGPSHTVVSGWHLGGLVDAEYNGFPTPDADGDDLLGMDDESGFSFGPLVPGTSGVVTFGFGIPSGETGYLNGWLDFGGDGSFGETNDHFLVDLMVFDETGSSPYYSDIVGFMTIPIPHTAVPGLTYARFRLSSTPGISFGGSGGYGEVEDSLVTIGEADLADRAAIRARLVGVPPLVEEGGVISYSIVISNLGPATATGVRLVGVLPPLMTVESVSADKGTARLDGNDIVCTLGELALLETVTLRVTLGTDTLLLPPTEIEIDQTSQTWQVMVDQVGFDATDNVLVASTGVRAKRDFGDAPDSFQTVLSSGGPRHGIRPGWRLGARIDRDSNGMPTTDADGDDLSGGPDDEDGVQFLTPLVASLTATVRVDVVCPVGSNAYLNAWIDLDGDNTFTATNEHLIVGAVVVPGANHLHFTVPTGATAGATYARFRLSGAPGLGYGGWAAVGEVEDYGSGGAQNLRILALDYGDAPDTYHTVLTNNGARHVVRSQLYLGLLADEENDGFPSPVAAGDNLAGLNDEEGLLVPPHLAPGFSGMFKVFCTITSASPAYVDGWVDYNTNGVFEHPGEIICLSVPVSTGTNWIAYTVPAEARPGQTFLRLRISSTGGLSPTGLAPNGEVEDYALTINPASPLPTLHSAYAGGQLTLSWDMGEALLESANVITGPWTTRSNAVSPLIVFPNAAQEFFRLKRIQ